jgi:hypothetical protein
MVGEPTLKFVADKGLYFSDLIDDIRRRGQQLLLVLRCGKIQSSGPAWCWQRPKRGGSPDIRSGGAQSRFQPRERVSSLNTNKSSGWCLYSSWILYQRFYTISILPDLGALREPKDADNSFLYNATVIKLLTKMNRSFAIASVHFKRKLYRRWRNCAGIYRCGTMFICRRAAMRSSSGGWVLKSEVTAPVPNIGFTMQRAEVVGDTAVVGMR